MVRNSIVFRVCSHLGAQRVLRDHRLDVGHHDGRRSPGGKTRARNRTRTWPRLNRQSMESRAAGRPMTRDSCSTGIRAFSARLHRTAPGPWTSVVSVAVLCSSCSGTTPVDKYDKTVFVWIHFLGNISRINYITYSTWDINHAAADRMGVLSICKMCRYKIFTYTCTCLIRFNRNALHVNMY